MQKRRLMFSITHQKLPIFMDTIGLNPNQEPIVRTGGYPHYHWLQTYRGEGKLRYNGNEICLKENSGCLLFPDVIHEYKSLTDEWETLFLTFNGPAASQILRSLGIHESAYFEWEPGTQLSSELLTILDNIESMSDPLGIQASSEVYRFLLTLEKFGRLHQNGAVSSNLKLLQPLIDALEHLYPNPDLGLTEMASILSITPRRMNQLFRDTFQLTPYAYLIYFRIRKAKELLIQHPKRTVREISEQVGFRNPSHFVATFRKHVGHPPEQFRQLL